MSKDLDLSPEIRITVAEIKNKKIYFPIMDNGSGSVRANYAACLIPAFNGLSVHQSRASDSLPQRARNKATADFLATDCTHLLFIDADIIFSQRQMELILEHDVPVVFGIYPKRQPELELCLCTLPDHVEDGEATLIRVKRAGTGFCLVRRDVIEQMRDGSPAKYPSALYKNHGRDEWNFWHADVVDLEYISEDWYFCDRWRAMGGDIWVDQRVQLKHEGDCVFPLARPVDGKK